MRLTRLHRPTSPARTSLLLICFSASACLPSFPSFSGSNTDTEEPGGTAGTTAGSDLDSDGYDAPADCNDFDPAVHPGAVEVCGGGDENCDGEVDEPDASGCALYGSDADGDGHGDPATTECLCAPTEALTTSVNDDCDDTNAEVFPGREILCRTRLVENCAPAEERAECTWAEADIVQLATGEGTRFTETAASGSFGNIFHALDVASGPSLVALGRPLDAAATAEGKEGLVMVYSAPLSAGAELFVDTGPDESGTKVEVMGRDKEAGFGRAVLLHPDLDGAGQPDLLVFSTGRTLDPDDSYIGVVPNPIASTSTVTPRYEIQLPPLAAGLDRLSLVDPGDLDQDGHTDLIISNVAGSVFPDTSVMWVIQGPVSETLDLGTPAASFRTISNTALPGHGARVSSAVASTGETVVAISAPGDSDIPGEVHIFDGEALLRSTTGRSDTVLKSNTRGASCGRATAFADFTGDGYLELAVSCPSTNDSDGVVYLFDRDTVLAATADTPLEELPALATFEGERAGDVTGLGFNLTALGDLDLVAGEELALVGINGGLGGARFVSYVHIGATVSGATSLPDDDFTYEVYAEESEDEPNLDIAGTLVGNVQLDRDSVPDLLVSLPGVGDVGRVLMVPGNGP